MVTQLFSGCGLNGGGITRWTSEVGGVLGAGCMLGMCDSWGGSGRRGMERVDRTCTQSTN